ncbi:hypothetical protein BKA62DRAFT_707110 [Auriculariales sp. MPI-PUGE-AT-0066]|nr:hypothetical protein BKA62DRAFT_707110 [Auriculariales sp. MPI-PUGE-AT-0066]
MSASTAPTAKKISNGTLSLRFMQRSKLAQQQNEVKEAPRIQNDAEWSIPGWRGRSTTTTSSQVVYESSLLPFLSPSQEDLPEAPPQRAYGRRVFKHGKEVQKSQQISDELNGDAAEDELLDSQEATSQRRSSTSQLLTTHRKARPSKFDPTKLARSSSGLSSTPVKIQPESSQTVFVPAAAGFLRPSGVDSPPSLSARKLGSVATAILSKKVKREADDPAQLSAQAKKKRKKDSETGDSDD